MKGYLFKTGRKEKGVMVKEFYELDAIKARKLLGSGEISSADLLESCIGRINAVNPMVNAVVTECFERARAEAKIADKLVKKKK